jgi:hypothetical protein
MLTIKTSGELLRRWGISRASQVGVVELGDE